ncbi:hypothetical protein BDN70DRAFT_350261 [Pholiota conissans]|uniref:Uncharacterized protein n=1 Tax=Pholiota conissans TaxID=109636 RepID=A0A9P5Z7N2_9AGAR|nr:hypothetical protein BDN70DRAFT_350261 [Pholiota conissans]
MFVTASPSPPSAKQALTSVVEDENTRAASHTQSLGLLSPIPSFTSILSISPTSASSSPAPLTSSSASSLSSASSSLYHAPRTPRTPLRSATTPKGRPSPLFRLLQPFAKATPISNPTTPTSCRTPMALAQPIASQPSSPTVSTARSSSRSERLLRDTLIRDEIERNPMLAAPLADSYESSDVMSSPSPKGHRRRHSHVPASTFSSSVVSSSPERDEYTRGTFLFRTAMSNPRSPSPTPVLPAQPAYYGGDEEGSPSTRRQRQHHHHHNHSHSVSYQPSPHSHARARSPLGGNSPRGTSHSPSPLRRRPAPLPLEGEGGGTAPMPVPGTSGLRRDNTISSHISESPSSRPRSRQGRALAGDPLVMTPHEQVLRARLERVLSAGRVVEHGEKEKQRRRAGQRSMSRGNEVRDEEGGWPWHERGEREFSGSVTSSPLYSAPSNNSGSSSNQSQQQLEYAMSLSSRVPSTVRAMSHSRSRSKTDPIPPPGSSSLGQGSPAPSPRRSSTAPTPSRIPRRKQSVPPSLIPRTGTTPPLVQGEDAEGEDVEDGEMRLLTPPPTPPFTARMFSIPATPRQMTGADGYCPSPYKAAFSPMKPLPTRTSSKAGLQFGNPRRPRNAPIERPQSSGSDQEHEHESSSSSSSHNSQASYPASNSSSTYAHRLRSRSADIQGDIGDALHSPIARHREHLPQFNARKASARCRAIEGYVSFASVEGLGEPPADPMSPDDADMEHERGRTGVLGVAWGGWKRLLNVAGLEGHPVKDGGVVL